MPYITCPDGKTYSRGDNSPYVVTCIYNEKQQYLKKHATCMLDIKCKSDYIAHQEKMRYFIGFSVILIIVMFFLLFKQFK